MANMYVVINKWTTSDPKSPGYMTGFRIAELLNIFNNIPDDAEFIKRVLEANEIDPAYFDMSIYSEYAKASLEVRSLGKIQGFTKAQLTTNLRYSMLVYSTEQDNIFVHGAAIPEVQKLQAAKEAYMKLVKIECETRRGYKDIDVEILAHMGTYDTYTLSEMQAIFDSLS